MMEGSPSWWNMNIPRPPSQKTSSHPFTSPSSSSSTSSPFNQYPQPSNSLPMIPCLDSQELPNSWRQLLLGEEEDRCSFTPFQPKRMEGYDHDHQVLYQSGSAQKVHVKQEISQEAGFVYGQRNEEFQPSWSSWSQTLPTSSPRSCITTSFNSSMLDFSNCKAERRNHQLDHSSECNSTATGSAFKKSRVQPSSTQSIFKVRKEKLGDRITALHQLVSPFGKTDTASVLLEAIGYIRFLQSQIQALSSPYLGGESGSMMQFAQGERSCIFPEDPGQLLNDPRMRRRGPCDQGGDEEPKKSLRSRGLCLVPMAFMLHVGSQNAADY